MRDTTGQVWDLFPGGMRVTVLVIHFTRASRPKCLTLDSEHHWWPTGGLAGWERYWFEVKDSLYARRIA